MRKRIIQLSLSIFTVYALVFSLAPVNQAQAVEKTWHFTNWSTTVEIQPNGDIRVTEETTAAFTGTFSWLSRTMPMQGRAYMDDIELREGDRLLDKDEYSVSNLSDLVTIFIYHNTTDAARTWTISYTVHNAINLFADFDELYWNAISDERDVVIDDLRVSVVLPEAVNSNEVRHKVYTGSYGSDKFVSNDGLVEGRVVEYQFSDVAAGKNATIVVDFPKGLVPDTARVRLNYGADFAEKYSSARAVDTKGEEFPFTGTVGYVGDDYGEIPADTVGIRVSRFGHEDFYIGASLPAEGELQVQVEQSPYPWFVVLVAIATIVLGTYVISPFIVFVYMILRWRRDGRDPQGRKTIIPEYESFNAMTSIAVGTIQDERCDMVDITALIIELAVKGYIVIEEDESGDITLLYTSKSIDDLLPFEKALLTGIFGPKLKPSVKLEDMRYKFSKHITTIRNGVQEWLVAEKYFEKNPDDVRRKYRAIALFLIIFGFVTVGFYGAGVPLIINGFIVLAFSKYMPKRTRRGVEAREWNEGYKMYLHHAERYRIERMTVETFESSLPHAIVFGVEKEWAKQFKDIYKEGGVEWYRSPAIANFSTISLVDNLMNTTLSQVESTLTAVQSTSGSSTSGGSGFSGGFSGGGFGGGGSSAG